MRRWLSRLKISHKVILGFLGLIAFPFTLLLVCNFASYAVQYDQQLTQNGQYLLGMMTRDVEEKLDHVEMLVEALCSNQRLTSFLSHDYAGALSYEEYTQTVLPLLQGAGNTVSPPIERIYLLTGNESIPEGYSTVYHYDSVPEQVPWSLVESKSEGIWYESDEEGEEVLYYLCPITSSAYKNEGVVLAKMRAQALFFEISRPQEGGTALFLLDENNIPRFGNVQVDQDFQFPEDTVYQGPVRYFSTDIDRLPLRVGVALPAAEHGFLQQNSLLTLVFMGVLSFLFLYLFFSMLRSIIARLRRYGEDMERIAVSDFGGELVVERQDEIGTIGDQFNQVLGRMRTLIRENIQKETAYKDAQLKALLLQINPHFIYNTLDMFAGKLTLDGEVETADYICDFAQLIRYNTMAATTSLPLDRELEHVRNYVNLQKCRYGDGVVLRIHASEELRQITIPRFLLQPIVENAFDHGFEGKAPEEERLIVISARKVGNRLILRVRDNGKGMSPQQVEEMNRKFSQPYDATALRHEKERGIGLENINDRLQIFSHSNDRLVLRSREGRYTSMFILQTLEGAAGSGEENETKD